MEEHDLVESKASYEKAIELARPRSGRLIGERRMQVDGSSSQWSTRRGQELSLRENPGSSSRKLTVCTRNHDEPDWAERIELLSQLSRDWNRRMEDEPPVVESNDRHANRDRNQASLPAELVLGAPQVRVMLD